jgi:hypothetical protein
LALLALYLADAATRTSERVAALACAILPIYVGRLTKSDSVTVMLVTATPIFLALKLWGWLFAFGPKPTLRPALAWIVVFALPLLLISGIPFRTLIAGQVEQMAKDVSKENGESSKRSFAFKSGARASAEASNLECSDSGPDLILKYPMFS